MALSAEQLYKASQFAPSAYGTEIIDPNLSEESQRAQAVAYIETEVLPGAKAEVAVPFRLKTNCGTVREFVETRYAAMGAEKQQLLIVEGESLFDTAVKSYGRSELNKIVDSNSPTYDKDSDQDRIQGNQRLQKLLEWAAIANVADVSDAEESLALEQLHSHMVFVSPVWGQGTSLGYEDRY